jgi:hypothetical protein
VVTDVNWRTHNRLRAAKNVSKCGHNVTGALSGCRFRDREVDGSNPLAPDQLNQLLTAASSGAVFHLWPIRGHVEKPLPFVNRFARMYRLAVFISLWPMIALIVKSPSSQSDF